MLNCGTTTFALTAVRAYSYLEHAEQQSLIRGEALIGSLGDIENIVVGNSSTGTPILVRNLATVHFAPIGRSRIQHGLDARIEASWSVSEDRTDGWWSDYSFDRVVMHRGLSRSLVLNLSGD